MSHGFPAAYQLLLMTIHDLNEALSKGISSKSEDKDEQILCLH